MRYMEQILLLVQTYRLSTFCGQLSLESSTNVSRSNNRQEPTTNVRTLPCWHGHDGRLTWHYKIIRGTTYTTTHKNEGPAGQVPYDCNIRIFSLAIPSSGTFLLLCVKSSQVKSSSGATRPRGDHAGPNSSRQPYAGYGDLIGVGRRRNLSEAACYRNWPRSRQLRDALRESQERMAQTSMCPPVPLSGTAHHANYRYCWCCQVKSSQVVGLRLYSTGQYFPNITAIQSYQQQLSSQVKSSSGATRPRGDHPDPNVKSSRDRVSSEPCFNVKSSQVVGLRDRLAIIRALLDTISSPPNLSLPITFCVPVYCSSCPFIPVPASLFVKASFFFYILLQADRQYRIHLLA